LSPIGAEEPAAGDEEGAAMFEDGEGSGLPQLPEIAVAAAGQMIAVDPLASQADWGDGGQWFHGLHDSSGP
ncbi:hypothetical protein JVV71_22075, partial [Vibrio cholerae O1]|nr:hypothetical protein [Vibrio cholerae O1]